MRRCPHSGIWQTGLFIHDAGVTVAGTAPDLHRIPFYEMRSHHQNRLQRYVLFL